MPTPPHPTRSLRTFLTGLVDYAGLFPPAKLDMQKAVETYARCARGEHEWMLGRFICPAARLAEFEKTAGGGGMLPGTLATSGYREYAEHSGGGEPWRLSVLVDASSSAALDADLDAIAAFNERHTDEDHGMAVIDAVELKVDSPTTIDRVLDEMPEYLSPFFEIPTIVEKGEDCRGFVAALSGSKASAKIRTGGVTPEAYPSAFSIAAFLRACHAADVPFKATAGLHHPIRSEHALTYEAGSVRGVMHGFVNVFLAAAFVRVLGTRLDDHSLVKLLSETKGAAFAFTDEGATWTPSPSGAAVRISATDLARVRESFALSFGSCSFDEPVEDVTGLGWM